MTCHLGNGASLAAVRDGKSVDTTMGFTPLEGPHDGDALGLHRPRHSHLPGAAPRLRRRDVDRVLNKESGLKGVSGISGDMREILAAMAAGDERARLAFDIYAHRLCREIGGMVAAWAAWTRCVFTAGIGENCAPLRAAVCRTAGVPGHPAGCARRTRTPRWIATSPPPDSRVRVLVVHTDEDWEIARECWRLRVSAPVGRA